MLLFLDKNKLIELGILRSSIFFGLAFTGIFYSVVSMADRAGGTSTRQLPLVIGAVLLGLIFSAYQYIRIAKDLSKTKN
jgi:hypothetical protein